MSKMFFAENLFDLDRTEHPGLFGKGRFSWEVLPKIAGYLANLEGGFRIDGKVWNGAHVVGAVHIGKGSVVEPGAVIKGPAWIGENVQVRAGCYIRENVIIGGGSVVGNSCEFKNCVLFQDCEVPHFNYVGDSILGHKAHLGAGVILSNVRLLRDEVVLRFEGEAFRTGLRKFGALIGDFAEVGCNCVLNPGSVIGRRSLIAPGIVWSGVLPENSVVRRRDENVILPRR